MRGHSSPLVFLLLLVFGALGGVPAVGVTEEWAGPTGALWSQGDTSPASFVLQELCMCGRYVRRSDKQTYDGYDKHWKPSRAKSE